MDDIFLDTSWSLYHHPIPNEQTYRKIFTSSTTAETLTTYSTRLATYITSIANQPKDDFDNESEKLGTFRDCRWTFVRRPSPSTSTSSTTSSSKRSIFIEIVYQKQTYKAVLFSPYLTLIKASASHTKLVFDFLGDSFGISLDTLKLAPEFVQDVLASYITSLSNDGDGDADGDAGLTRLSILKTAVANVKLSIAFSGPVAPGLKSIDLDIPYETVDSLIARPQSVSASSESQSRSAVRRGSDSTGLMFLSSLAHYIMEQTGIKLPLHKPAEMSTSATTGADGSHDSDSTSTLPSGVSPAKMARVTTAFWVLSVEGKVKFAGRAVDGASSYEDAVRAAGADILVSIDREARTRVAAASE